MSSSRHGGHENVAVTPEDLTFHLELPGNWKDYPTSPIDASPIEGQDRFANHSSAIPDHEGLIPVRPVDEEYPIPVETAPRRARLATLALIGSTYLQQFPSTSGQNAVESKLSAQLAVFFHLGRTGHLKDVNPVTIEVFNKLAVNVELVQRQVSQDWSDLPNLIPCEIEGGVFVEVVPPSIAVVQTFSRLFDLLNARNQRSHPAFEDNELEIIEFLQLYFIDVLNDSSNIEAFRISYKKNFWLSIKRMLSRSDVFPKLAHYIQNIDGETARQKALGVEGWIRMRMAAFLHSRGEIYSNQMLPTGEIAYRILKVWTKLRNVLIQVWQDEGDTQVRRMVPWSLSTVPRSTATAPSRIGHCTRSGKEESLWSFGEEVIKRARSDTQSARTHEISGDLISPITRLVHLEAVAQMPGVINSSAIFVAKHLVLDSALVMPEKEVLWPELDGIRRPSVRLDNNRTLSFVWPALQVAQVLYRLEEINREVGRDQDRVDKDRQWAQLLQLFFIDIIDSCSALETFHTKWDPRTWTRICQKLPYSSQLGIAFQTIQNTDLDNLSKVADNVEEWVLKKIRARSEHSVDSLARLEAVLPKGEIALRIVRVWGKFRNAMIEAWRMTNDPRAALPLWPIPEAPTNSNRRINTDPNRAIREAARRLSSSAAFISSSASQPPPLHIRRGSLPLHTIASSSSSPSHTPISRNPHRQSLASSSPHASPPASPFVPPRSFTRPPNQQHPDTTPRSRTPPAVIHSIGGAREESTIPSSVFQPVKREKGRKRDFLKGLVGKGRRKEGGGGGGGGGVID